MSDWADANSPQAVEVANAPDRAAVVVFDAMKGGYIVQRGGQSQTLPRDWFGAGPPRRDISIAADGRHLAIPDGDAIVVYDVDAKRWLKRLDAPEPGAKGKMSADGRHVVWTSLKGACSMTEIATGTPNKKCS